jgi:hypothetical protein
MCFHVLPHQKARSSLNLIKINPPTRRKLIYFLLNALRDPRYSRWRQKCIGAVVAAIWRRLHVTPPSQPREAECRRHICGASKQPSFILHTLSTWFPVCTTELRLTSRWALVIVLAIVSPYASWLTNSMNDLLMLHPNSKQSQTSKSYQTIRKAKLIDTTGWQAFRTSFKTSSACSLNKCLPTGRRER